jgi:beta-glucanase (GH16 family)
MCFFIRRLPLLARLMAAMTITLSSLAAQPVLIWSDEFEIDGPPDPGKWQYDVGGHGWGNEELQYYTEARPANARVEGGVLVIEAHKETWMNLRDFVGTNDYTSARLVSKGHGDWQHGRVEVRAKLPAGRGTWPAIWMLATGNPVVGWPYSGEIDHMEHVGYDMGTVHGSFHHSQRFGQNALSASIAVESVDTTFHVYALEWDPDEMRISVDGTVYSTYANLGQGVETWPYVLPFYLILNVAVGGHWGGLQGVDPDIWPQRMEVDYVRVYDLGNTATLDTDSDLILNAEDPDDDGDGLSDVEEHAIGTNLHVPDTDGDGFNDFQEVEAGSSPFSIYSVPGNAGHLLVNPDFSMGNLGWAIVARTISGDEVAFVTSSQQPNLLTDYINIGSGGNVTFSNFNGIGITESWNHLFQDFGLGHGSEMNLKRGDVITFRGTASATASSGNVLVEAMLQLNKSQTEVNTEVSRFFNLGDQETDFVIQLPLETGDVSFLLIGFRIYSTPGESGTVTFRNLEATVTTEGMWGPWTIASGWIDSESWMGWMNVVYDPWLWSQSLTGWVYVPSGSFTPSGGWVYIPSGG